VSGLLSYTRSKDNLVADMAKTWVVFDIACALKDFD